MLGYCSTTKGYRLYDIDRKRVFYSRDVVCDEQETGVKKEIPKEQSCQDKVQGSKEKTDNEKFVEIISERDLTDVTPEDYPSDKGNSSPGPRHSGRLTRKPDWYGDRVACTAADYHRFEMPSLVLFFFTIYCGVSRNLYYIQEGYDAYGN